MQFCVFTIIRQSLKKNNKNYDPSILTLSFDSTYSMSTEDLFFRCIPQSSVHQLLPLLFSDNGKEVWHHSGIVSSYRVKKAACTASTVIPILHLKRRSHDGHHTRVIMYELQIQEIQRMVTRLLLKLIHTDGF